MTKRKAAPKREDTGAIMVLVMGFFLTLALVVTAAFNLPQPGTRYDAMKAATVELSLTGGGHGSGVIISPNFILTVAHVASVAKGLPMDVLFANGRHGQAVEVWEDPTRDVALMVLLRATKIEPAHLSATNLVAGDEVWAVGYPFDLPLMVQHGTVASGEVISGGDGEAEAAIMIDVVIAPGDSGGPVFNLAGEVVGLNDFHVKGFGLGGIIAVQAILAEVRSVTGLN